MPYISTEALVGGALLVVLALGYQYVVAGKSDFDTASPAKKKRKTNKKKNKPSSVDEVISVTTASASEPETAKSTKSEKKAKGKQRAAVNDLQHPAQPSPAPVSPEPVTTPEESKSFADVASDVPRGAVKPKMLAEKLLPKPRKTKVDE